MHAVNNRILSLRLSKLKKINVNAFHIPVHLYYTDQDGDFFSNKDSSQNIQYSQTRPLASVCVCGVI